MMASASDLRQWQRLFVFEGEIVLEEVRDG
jgi:hypothetical protein